MLVFVQVSSMKTSRPGSTRSWYLIHWLRRRATSGRSCSTAINVFFMREFLVVDELPDRSIIDGKAAFAGEFAHQTTKRERLLAAAHPQPINMAVSDRSRFEATDLTGCDAAGFFEAFDPFDRRARSDTEPEHGLSARHACHLHCCHNALAKVHRIGFRHPCWPPPSQNVESQSTLPWNPHRFSSMSSRCECSTA